MTGTKILPSNRRKESQNNFNVFTAPPTPEFGLVLKLQPILYHLGSCILRSNMENPKIIYAPHFLATNEPIVFLAGPIQGAEYWQSDAMRLIHSLRPDLVIASPRRPVMPDPTFDYDEQVKWESEYLKRAGENGVILFWLAKEKERIEGRQYAQTTRHEIAEWMVKHQYFGSKIAVGIEDGFLGDRYIRHRLATDCPDVKVHNSLADLCQVAVSKIFS